MKSELNLIEDSFHKRNREVEQKLTHIIDISDSKFTLLCNQSDERLLRLEMKNQNVETFDNIKTWVNE